MHIVRVFVSVCVCVCVCVCVSTVYAHTRTHMQWYTSSVFCIYEATRSCVTGRGHGGQREIERKRENERAIEEGVRRNL